MPERHFRRSSWNLSPVAPTWICEFLDSGARLEFGVASVGENNNTSECQRLALF